MFKVGGGVAGERAAPEGRGGGRGEVDDVHTDVH
jgi:hypothetical protein